MSDNIEGFDPDDITELAAALDAAAQEMMEVEADNAAQFYGWIKKQTHRIAERRGVTPSEVLNIMFVGTVEDFAEISRACCEYLATGDYLLEDELVDLALHVGDLAHDLLKGLGRDPHTGEENH
jgi:hypothetical protein